MMMMKKQTAFGEWLRELEKLLHVGPNEIAARVGSDPTTISYLKSGRHNVSWKLALRFRKAYGVDLNALADKDISHNGGE